MLLAGCAGYADYSSTATDEYGNPRPIAKSAVATDAAQTPKPPAIPSPLVLTQSSIGGVLADKASGKTLYTFAKDARLESRCYEACASAWPPFFSDSAIAVNADITVVERKDGKLQWALKGQPLYFWAGDQSAGDTNGDAIPEWDAARP